MEKKSREVIKEFFKNGLKPNENEFGYIIDSSLNLVDDKISIKGDFIGIKTNDPKAYLHIDRTDLDKKKGGIKKTPSFMVGQLKGNYTTISDNQISGNKNGKSDSLFIQPFGGTVKFNAELDFKNQIVFRETGRIGIGVESPIAPIHIAIPYLGRKGRGAGMFYTKDEGKQDGKILKAAKDEVIGFGGAGKKTPKKIVPKGTSGAGKRTKDDPKEKLKGTGKEKISIEIDPKKEEVKKDAPEKFMVDMGFDGISADKTISVKTAEDVLGIKMDKLGDKYDPSIIGSGDYYDVDDGYYDVDGEAIEEDSLDEAIEEVKEDVEVIEEVVEEEDDPIKLPEERTPIALFLGNVNDISLSLCADEISAKDNGKGASLYLNRDGGNIVHFGSIIHSSDKKLKHNIKPLNKGISHLLKLKPVSYKWKVETGNEQDTKYGFIAQDVEKVLKEIVYTEKSSGRKGISSIELIPVLVKAIQQQNTKIESLETRMKKLEKLVLKK